MRSGARFVMMLALVGSAAGCWRQVGNGPAHSYFNGLEDRLTIDNVTDLSQRWSTVVDGASSEPMIFGGRAFVSGVDESLSTTGMRAEVQSLDTSTGDNVWTATVSASWPQVAVAPVILVEEDLWVSYGGLRDGRYCDGAVLRLDRDTGEVLESVFAGFASAPVHFGDRVAFTGHAIDRASCARSSPNRLFVMDVASRSILWSGPVPAVMMPAVVGDRIVVGRTAFAADGCGATSCAAVWTSPVGGYGPLAGSPDGRIFVGGGDSNGELVAIDPLDGHQLWSSSEHYEFPLSGIAVAGDDVFVLGDDDLRVYSAAGCGQSTCSALWSADLQGSAGQPVVAGGVLYVPTTQNIAIFPAAGCAATTCVPIMTIDVDNWGTSAHPITVADGQLFVHTLDISVLGVRLAAYGPST